MTWHTVSVDDVAFTELKRVRDELDKIGGLAYTYNDTIKMLLMWADKDQDAEM